MKTDAQIQKDVMDQLKWEPLLTASQIGVAVKEGVVTLSGQVDSYFKKTKAEEATKKVSGVKAIAEEMQIGVSPAFNKTDTEIAEAIVNALKWHAAVQEDKIKIKVENGAVILEGEVEWEFQRLNARMAVENLAGVKSISNFIRVKPKVSAVDIKTKITAAFARNATIDAARITADVNGSTVILTGNVRSIAEKEDAEAAAWAAPGVTNVDSKLKVVLPEYSYED